MSTPVGTAGASAKTGVPAKTLRSWRYLNRGPAYFKLEGRAYYDPDELEAWMKARRKGSST